MVSVCCTQVTLNQKERLSEKTYCCDTGYIWSVWEAEAIYGAYTVHHIQTWLLSSPHSHLKLRRFGSELRDGLAVTHLMCQLTAVWSVSEKWML